MAEDGLAPAPSGPVRGPIADGVTGVVICGGHGRRIQPAAPTIAAAPIEKGLVLAGGREMVAAVLDRLSPQVDAVVVNANRRLDRYRALGHPVVPDVLADAGPLAGLLAAMPACRTRWLATVPCDAPALPRDLVARLADAAVTARARAAFARCGDRAQPVFALVDTSLRPDLERYLHAGGRRLDAWFASVDAVPVDFGDPASFVNINTATDLAAFEASLS
ncbi:MAG: molybdenum cofactor guanylyltransferase MobA [Lautropia sp.]